MLEFIRSYSERVWNAKDMSAVDTCFANDVILHSPLQNLVGPAAMKDIIKVWLTAFPDLYVEHEAFIAEGDTVVSQWKASGTHKGPFKDIAPTGQPVSYTGVSIYRLRDGKVAEYWAYVNLHQLMESLRSPASV